MLRVPMAARAARRLGQALLLYLVLCLFYSLVLDAAVTPEIRASIREAASAAVGGKAGADKQQWVAAQEAAFGLDQGLVLRSAVRALRIARWDFGWTTAAARPGGSPQPVAGVVLAAFGQSAVLFGWAAVAIMVLGTPLGAGAARFPRGWANRIVRILGPLGQGLPAWWLGLVLLMATFWVLPRSLFSDPLTGLLLSVLTIVLLRIWGWGSLTAGLVQPGSDAVEAARARGIPEVRIVWRHILRPSLGPVAKMGGQSLAQAFTGDVLVEVIFQRPGIGLLFWQAVQSKALLLALGCLVVLSLGICLFYAILDLVDEALDPRVSLRSSASR